MLEWMYTEVRQASSTMKGEHCSQKLAAFLEEPQTWVDVCAEYQEFSFSGSSQSERRLSFLTKISATFEKYPHSYLFSFSSTYVHLRFKSCCVVRLNLLLQRLCQYGALCPSFAQQYSTVEPHLAFLERPPGLPVMADHARLDALLTNVLTTNHQESGDSQEDRSLSGTPRGHRDPTR